MLKNVLSLLLSKFYSKKESELVGHQAMPSSQSISITPTVNSVGDEVATVATFNAQADGFVIVRATTDGAPASRLILSSYVSTYIFNNSAGGTIATFIPIAKGIQCTVQGRNLKNIVISLYKTIGGVQTFKDALLQGGGLCLNSLSSSLRRSFCRVKDRGFNTQSVHHLRRTTSLSLKTMRGTLLRPVRTVTLRSQGTPRVSFWKFPQAARGLLIAEHLRGDTSFLSQRVSHSHTWCHLIQLLTRFILSQCGLKTNSAVGGASC